ncbi:MAG: hypothetical protein WBE68_24500, partial [Candidatus Nitrosopolaris sp.]
IRIYLLLLLCGNSRRCKYNANECTIIATANRMAAAKAKRFLIGVTVGLFIKFNPIHHVNKFTQYQSKRSNMVMLSIYHMHSYLVKR